jgi:uncharacterized membrane protein YedE/YeeE
MISVQLLNAAVGGALLSFSVLIFSIVYGRVVGISGIVNNAVFKKNLWQILFLLGMIIIGIFQEKANLSQDLKKMGLSGFLVGFGVTMGNGCTSGHGLCGLARKSKRSIVAVLTFMVTAMVTRLFVNDLLNEEIVYQEGVNISEMNIYLLKIAVLGALIGSFFSKKLHIGFVSLFVGMIFALGLSISGMIVPENILRFLNLSLVLNDAEILQFVNPSMGVVLIAGLLPNFIMHKFITTGLAKPLSGCKWNFPHSTIVDLRLVLGAVMFGIGWGIGGICPGPGVVLLPQAFIYENTSILAWWAGTLSGMYFIMKTV